MRALLTLTFLTFSLSALAVENPGPVVFGEPITVCRNAYDHAKSMQFVQQDPMAWVKFDKETLADRRCWSTPAGKKVFAMERVDYPTTMERLRVQVENGMCVELALRDDFAAETLSLN